MIVCERAREVAYSHFSDYGMTNEIRRLCYDGLITSMKRIFYLLQSVKQPTKTRDESKDWKHNQSKEILMN